MRPPQRRDIPFLYGSHNALALFYLEDLGVRNHEVFGALSAVYAWEEDVVFRSKQIEVFPAQVGVQHCAHASILKHGPRP